MKKIFLMIIISLIGYASGLGAPDQKVITLDEFIEEAPKTDTEFEQILIRELSLKYQKALTLPAGDLVISVKQQHDFFLDQNRSDPKTTASLTKLFPLIGTEIEASYFVDPSARSTRSQSGFQITMTQPIAENAFGHSTRLLDQSVDVQIQTARHQIVEAYEDYLAFIVNAYIEWYEDYENLQISRSSFQENLKLLDNIKDRRKSGIALPVDVNKTSLQVFSKRENLVELEETYKRSRNTIERILRYKTPPELIPQKPGTYQSIEGEFDEKFTNFQNDSRTFNILRLLEEQTELNLKRDANTVLPSIDMVLTFGREGEEYQVENGFDVLSAGITLDWPIPDQVARARKKTSEISVTEQKLETENAYYRLYVNLKDLFFTLQKQDELIAIAKEKLDLSKSVLADESENYSFGRITLNDYIRAVNEYDANRFNLNFHESLKNRLILEWKRLTDTLILRNDIKRKIE